MYLKAAPFRGGPADFAQVLKSKLETWQKVAKEGALRLDLRARNPKEAVQHGSIYARLIQA